MKTQSIPIKPGHFIKQETRNQPLNENSTKILMVATELIETKIFDPRGGEIFVLQSCAVTIVVTSASNKI